VQLDKTRIGIRERNFGEILDLSLRVVREHAPALALTTAIGAAPFALFHLWWFAADYNVLVEGEGPDTWYLATLVSFLVLEIPLAMALTTLYLGRVLFAQQSSARALAGDFIRLLPQILFLQGALRFLFVGPALATLVLLDGPARSLVVMPLLLWLFPFARWPYLSEVILLERNPLRQPRGSRKRGLSKLSTWRRSWNLHALNIGELLLRWFISIAVAGILVGGLWTSIFYLRQFLLAETLFDRAMVSLYLQLVVWATTTYFTVVRFLSYLDLRIRTEGWEIELKMRAEAARLAGQLS